MLASNVYAAIFMSLFPSKMDVGIEDSMLDIMFVRSSGLDCVSPITWLYLSSVFYYIVVKWSVPQLSITIIYNSTWSIHWIRDILSGDNGPFRTVNHDYL